MQINDIDVDILSNQLIQKYKFTVSSTNILKGRIFEYQDTEILYDYEIEIDLNPVIKFKLPTIKELSGLIKRDVEVHVYPSTGHLCLCHPEEEYAILKKIYKNIEYFIENYVKGYFRAYTLYEINNKWPTKEYSHNREQANIEFIEYYLNVSVDLGMIRRLLGLINNRKANCYCGSGKNIKKCHLHEFDIFLANFRTDTLLKRFILKVQRQLMQKKNIKY